MLRSPEVSLSPVTLSNRAEQEGVFFDIYLGLGRDTQHQVNGRFKAEDIDTLTARRNVFKRLSESLDKKLSPEELLMLGICNNISTSALENWSREEDKGSNVTFIQTAEFFLDQRMKAQKLEPIQIAEMAHMLKGTLSRRATHRYFRYPQPGIDGYISPKKALKAGRAGEVYTAVQDLCWG